MADRIPLIVNPTASQIQELPNQDDLVLSGQLKMTGTALGGSDINLSGGSDGHCVITVTGHNSNVSKLTIDGRGNGSGSGKTNIAEFIVTGTTAELKVKGDITAFATSDATLKENLVPISNALNKVGIITGYTYKWKTEGTDYAGVHGTEDTGVVAQDVELLGLPGITTTRENGIKAISYKRLTPILIQAIKELKKENDDLKTLIKDSSSFQNLRTSL